MKTNPFVRLTLFAAGVYLGLLATAGAAATQGKKSAAPVREEAPPAISVDVRPQLFATLCALDAAGFDAGGNTSDQVPARIQLRDRMRALQGPAVSALRAYYREHALGDSGETLSRFVSFALVVGPPPKFAFELNREELPPDALALDGFNEVLANFYREAGIDQLWALYQPDYDRGVEAYRAPVSEIVFAAASYLREIVKSDGSRTFSVYVEPLVGGKTNFRNYGNHYALVVSASTDPPIDSIRHAFLHFLLDPLVIRYQTEVAKTSSLLDYAAHAPRLPVEFHDDFPAFFDECLVRAVELRLRRLAPADLSSEIDQAEGDGYVLVRPIYAGLSGFEKSEPSMSYYLPDLIKGIDVAAEARRLRGVKFEEAAFPGDVARAVEERAAHSKSSVSARTSVDGDLAEGQRQIAARNGAAAAVSFDRVLATIPNDPRATYGLAVASALLGNPERARELFTKVIAAAQNSPGQEGAQPDPSSLSWSHIYLGRMYDVEGNRDLAVAEYRAALGVSGVPEAARAAAQRGVETGYQTPPRENESSGKP